MNSTARSNTAHERSKNPVLVQGYQRSSGHFCPIPGQEGYPSCSICLVDQLRSQLAAEYRPASRTTQQMVPPYATSNQALAYASNGSKKILKKAYLEHVGTCHINQTLKCSRARQQTRLPLFSDLYSQETVQKKTAEAEKGRCWQRRCSQQMQHW